MRQKAIADLLLATIVGTLLLFSLVNTAFAVVLTFDDINVQSGESIMPSTYAGFTWVNTYVHSYNYWHSRVGDGIIPPPSGDVYTINGGGDTTYVLSSSDFDFNGAYFGNLLGFGNWIEIYGYNDFQLVGQYSIDLNPLRRQPYSYYNVNMHNVDTLVFASNRSLFTMDNFTYNETAVPEPATLFLLGSGLVGLLAGRRMLKL